MHVLGEIERHMRRTGIPQTRFGREAVGDPRLVADLRNGRELRQRTAQRIAAYIATHRSDAR